MSETLEYHCLNFNSVLVLYDLYQDTGSSLCFSFYICKTGTLIAPTSQDYHNSLITQNVSIK